MKYKLCNANINNDSVFKKLENKIIESDYDLNKEYDIDINYYNFDLINDKLDINVNYEIKKDHYLFLKKIREFFDNKNIKINEINLIGTVSNIYKGDMSINVIPSKYQQYYRNNIVPCKEIFLFEDSKKALDMLLQNEQISEEEYEINIQDLQDELDIDFVDEESEYIN